MIKLEQVLVATDFGPASDSALTYAREMARNFGARLHVLHVIENPMMSAGSEGVGIDIASLQAEIEKAARGQLAKLVTSEDRQELKAISLVRTGNSPAFEIVSYAKTAGIDLIVLGTHGRRAIAHLLMGSVAEKVVRLAPCPVLTVRNPEHEFVLPDALEPVSKARP